MSAILYSVVIPTYNSSRSLDELYRRLVATFAAYKTDSYEIVFVDDASPDPNVWLLLEKLVAANPRVRAIQHARNFGQHKATLCGLRHSRGKYAITLDDDLQHPPEEIVKLIAAIESDPNLDAVIGSYDQKQHTGFRNLGSALVNGLMKRILHGSRDLQMTSFRIIRREMVEEMAKSRIHNPRIGHLLLAVTLRIKNVLVAHSPRAHGKSTYSLKRLISDALDNILNHTALPLQLVSLLGFGSAFLSTLLAIFLVYRYFSVSATVPGWTSITAILLFFFGVLLFSFGIVGEYLIRILRELQGSSQSIVRRQI